MKTKLMLSAAVTLFVANLAVAPIAHATLQQDKMKACNADAKEKKGDERKAFMKQCLSAKMPEESSAKEPAETSAAMTTQRQKMRTCNADAKAKALKGDERKKFMSTCLKG